LVEVVAMSRSAVLAAAFFATFNLSAGAQEPPRESAREPAAVQNERGARRDRFVVSSDACGASRYQHLLGREFAQVYQTAMLPADTTVQNGGMFRTLEYTPHRLRVVLGGDGRIITIGCF
jgi:hypothetical protein